MRKGFQGRPALFRRPHLARTLLLLMAVVFLVVFVVEVEWSGPRAIELPARTGGEHAGGRIEPLLIVGAVRRSDAR